MIELVLDFFNQLKHKSKETHVMAKKKDQLNFNPWSLEINAVAHSLSGNKAADIDKLLDKAIVEEALLKAAIKKLELLLENPDALPEEISAAAAEVKTYQKNHKTYKAPLNVIHRDKQKLGNDNGPLPFIAQHFILAAFRDEASSSFSDEFCLATQENRKGRIGKAHMRKYIQITPYHIFLFKDPEYNTMFENSDIIVEGQQPVGDVKGFSNNEVIVGPIYFKFQMMFQPKGKFPPLGDRDLVLQCLYQSTFRGLGGRRAANYGQWEILKAKFIDLATLPFVVEGLDNERNSLPN
jgi:hypothetical protein